MNERANFAVTLQVPRPHAGVPEAATIARWINVLPVDGSTNYELTVRVVDVDEGRALNKKWRGVDKPTNVLSFPLTDEFLPHYLGDIVVCAPLVENEARAQGKAVEAHWAHLIVHGVLHLLGYGHDEAEGAKNMEAVEREVLAEFGFPDPYLVLNT
ncbi:MAG: rRNA maturation RNase YbeY [Pseudomonadota bacterium]